MRIKVDEDLPRAATVTLIRRPLSFVVRLLHFSTFTNPHAHCIARFVRHG